MLLELLEISCRELQCYRQYRPLECILLNCLQASPNFLLFLMLPEILDFFFARSFDAMDNTDFWSDSC